MNVLIIGGYGTFGFGMAERLSDVAGLEIILAGRSLAKAKAACAELSGAATFTPLKLDRTDLELGVTPDLIIDASGPFQAYGGQSVVDYCLAQGIHYADISDDGAFVAAVMARAEAARAAGVTLVSGLSTCPVLSAIGLREIEAAIGPAADVTIGIAPSPKAALGRNVVAAVANYAGQRTVSIRREGHRETVAGLTEVRNETICVPGDVPLPRLPFAVADAPDAWVLHNTRTQLNNIWTGAGTRPVWLHRLLVWLSRGVAKGVAPKLTPFTDLFHRARGVFKFGIHRGGMFVRGRNSASEASWHLVAESDDGPRIPALPVVALVRKMQSNEPIETGAFSGDQIIGLTDLAPEFSKLNIAYGLQTDGANTPVYEKVMGDAYARLHPAVAELHRTGEGRVFAGRCTVTRGRNPLSHVVAWVVGFPKSGADVPVSVTVVPDSRGETWTRDFGGKKFSSHHSLKGGRWARHITERFGPMAVHMAIVADGKNMRIAVQGWSIFGLPLPKFLRPGGDVYETQDAHGRFVFHVDLRAPGFGRLCKYEGWLEPSRAG